MNAIDTFRQDFEALDRAKGPLQAFRRAGWERFKGLPTTREEAWRFTDLSPLARESFPLGRPSTNGTKLRGDLVFVDGHYRPDLSMPPEGVARCRPRMKVERALDELGHHVRRSIQHVLIGGRRPIWSAMLVHRKAHAFISVTIPYPAQGVTRPFARVSCRRVQPDAPSPGRTRESLP